ncbi:MAG: hypothetical protein ABSB60_14285 [Terracidiphilus sp.]
MNRAMRRRNPIFRIAAVGSLWLTALAGGPLVCAQAPVEPEIVAPQAGPIAIISMNNKNGDPPSLTGALEVSANKAIIVASGSITSGSQTTEAILPHRGVLRICASTTVKLAADTSVPAGETPGLMMAFDHGAVEASFATGRNSDVLLTPDFRILIGGPGAAEVKVRLGPHGDTCVDNAGVNAPYVLVTGIFDAGDYHVKAGQRVMFQNGSVHEVVDDEKEPCGCPPAGHPGTNEFPLAESAGLAPLQEPTASAPNHAAKPQAVGPLVYKSADHTAQPAPEAQPAEAVPTPTPVPAVETPSEPPDAKQGHKKKHGVFGKIGHFFKKVFGAE